MVLGFESVNLGSITNTFYWIFYFIIFMAAVMALNYFVILKKVIYPIKAIIYVERDGGDIIEEARIRKKRSKNKKEKWTFFGIKRKNHSVEPAYKYLISDKRGKPVIHLKQTGDDNYFPIDAPVMGNDDFEVMKTDVKNWGVSEIEDLHQQYKNGFWAQYGQQVVMLSMLAICVFCIIYSLDIQKEVTETYASRVASTCKAQQAPQQQHIQATVTPQENTGEPPT